MKIVRNILIVTLLIILYPVKAYAATGSVSMTCTPTSVTPGATISCTIKGTTSGSVDNIEMKVNLGNGLSVLSFSKNDTVWNGGLDDNSLTMYVEDADQTGTFNIGTLSVKVSDSATAGSTSIALNNIVFYHLKEETNVNNESATITVGTGNSTSETGLSALTATNGVLSPQFNALMTSYVLTLEGDKTTFSLSATAKNSSDEVKFVNADTDETLDPTNITFKTSGGNQSMMIHITVGTGSDAKSYSVAVMKKVSADDGSYELASLQVGNQTVSLVSGKYEYTVQLSNTLSYDVKAELKNKTDYEIKNLISPRSGEGQFTIVVSPKDSSSGLKTQTYTITVTNGSGGSSGSSGSSGGGSTQPASSSQYTPSTPSTNPQTGGIVSVIMAVILLAAFGVSIYYYKKNIGYFNK